MQHLHWELSVLSRAVTYKNLSNAALHVGLSQPQISRIVMKVERELGVALLDRKSRRNSTWTPLAHRLSEVYGRSMRRLDGEVQKVVEVAEPSQLHIATLEGLIPLALKYCDAIYKHTSVKALDLNVYDLNELESLFATGGYDLIFTSREPGRRKFQYVKTLGYQSLERVSTGADVRVMSSSEAGSRAGGQRMKEGERVFVSNSLEVRRSWILKYGGEGVIPSGVRGRSSDSVAVLMIAVDGISPVLWKKIKAFE